MSLLGMRSAKTTPLADWSVDVFDDDEEGRTYINIRNPDDDIAAAGVNTYVVGNRRTLASQVLRGFHQAFRAALTAAPTPPAQQVSEPAAMNADLMQEAKTAIELAMDNLRSHGDNCFLHDDGEYDACFCGLDSLSDYLQSTVEAIEGAISAPAAEQPALPEDVAGELRRGNLPTLNQDDYPGLGDWWVQIWQGDGDAAEVVARVYGGTPFVASKRAEAVIRAVQDAARAAGGA